MINKYQKNRNNDALFYFDWVMCVMFGTLALAGFVLTLFVPNKVFVMGCALGLGLMSLAYSPLVEKPFPLRILLTILTLFVAFY